jgi:hypothetical protein
MQTNKNLKKHIEKVCLKECKTNNKIQLDQKINKNDFKMEFDLRQIIIWNDFGIVTMTIIKTLILDSPIRID